LPQSQTALERRSQKKKSARTKNAESPKSLPLSKLPKNAVAAKKPEEQGNEKLGVKKGVKEAEEVRYRN